jgi:hypothetical protein
MKIRFCQTLPESGTGLYAHYEHKRIHAEGWQILDVRAAAAHHRAAWSKSLFEWHSELCRRASKLTPLWWLSPGSRLTAWYPADLKPLFFALAIADAAANAPQTQICVIGAPEDVCEFLEEWREGSCPRQLSHSPQPTRPAHPLRLLLSLAARILMRHLRPEPVLKDIRTIAFSYTLRGDIFTQQDDHYFGKSLDGINGAEHTLWVYYLDFLSDLKPISAYLKEQGRRHAFYFDFLTLSDLSSINSIAYDTIDKLEPLSEDLPPLKIGGRSSLAFARKYFRDCVLKQPPIIEISVMRAFENLLKQTSVQNIVYPYEEKGIERAVLMAADKNTDTPRTIAFAHAVYNDGHFYLRSQRMPSPPPTAKHIAATSAESGRWLGELSGRDKEVDSAFGSPRFPQETSIRPPSPHFPQTLRILFLTGYGCELGLLADMAERMPELFDGCELLVRTYPYGWSEQLAGDEERLRRAVGTLRCESGSLEEQIEWCDVSLFASTSAGFHCMLRGRPTIHVDLHDHFALDPLSGRDTEGVVSHCPDEAALKESLQAIKAMSRAEYEKSARAHMKFAAGFYAPLDLDKISKELQEA